MKRYASVDAYLEDFPTPVQEILQKFRDTVRRAAPDAEEAVSYGMPAYKLGGVLVYFAAHTRHIGFYPTSTGIAAFKQELQRFQCSKGTVRFPLDRPVPYGLVARIVRYRVKENLAKARAKRLKQA